MEMKTQYTIFRKEKCIKRLKDEAEWGGTNVLLLEKS